MIKNSLSSYLHILRSEFKIMFATQTQLVLVNKRTRISSRISVISENETITKALLSFRCICLVFFFSVVFCLWNGALKVQPSWHLFYVSFLVEFVGRHPVRAAGSVWRSGPDYQQSHQLFNEHRDLFLWKWVFPWKLWKPIQVYLNEVTWGR